MRTNAGSAIPIGSPQVPGLQLVGCVEVTCVAGVLEVEKLVAAANARHYIGGDYRPPNVLARRGEPSARRLAPGGRWDVRSSK